MELELERRRAEAYYAELDAQRVNDLRFHVAHRHTRNNNFNHNPFINLEVED